jgi:hypothetical protein
VGLHFFVWPANQRAVGFYRHLGFTVISAEGSVIFTMDLRPAAGQSRPLISNFPALPASPGSRCARDRLAGGIRGDRAVKPRCRGGETGAA